MTTELKACPFCGGAARQESYIVEACVFCTSCDARVRAYHEPKEDTGTAKSAEVWNTRAPQWLPIGSAPKDGTHFLALSASKRQRVDYKHQEAPTPLFWQERPLDRYTHWQPLPAPPEVAP